MKKGKKVEIKLESIGVGGVITATTQSATVLGSSGGDTVTVKGEDGYIYDVDRYSRDDDNCYLVVA